MKYLDMEDLYEYLLNNNEIVFIYKEKIYHIDHDKYMFKVDRYNGDYKTLFDGKNKKIEIDVICRYKYKEQNMEAVEGFLNEKCYDGKSFYEIEKDVEIDRVY